MPSPLHLLPVARWLPIALFAVLWLDLIRLLGFTWNSKEQYAYGWFVPFFGLALLYRRWADRPFRVPCPQSEVSGAHAPSPSPHSALTFLVVILLGLLLLPLRVIFEINTDWPLVAWIYTLIVVTLTLYAFHLADPFPSSTAHLRTQTSAPHVRGLRSIVFSPWLRHFLFPVAFILVAVSWPWRVEKGLTQGLMQVVANLTVEILGWIDIPALQRGNLIELANGTLGVDEACSGIRSFQSTLMASLLMGELYRLRLLPRAALVLVGLTMAFCFNVIRTFILSYQANKEGISAIDKWHDPAGFMITVACFICLWVIAVFASKHWSSLPAGPPSSDPRPLNVPPQFQISAFKFLLFPFPPYSRFLFAVGIWSLLTILATEAWYAKHGTKAPSFVYWSVAMPETQLGFQNLELPPKTRTLLNCDVANTAKWQEEGGAEWTVYFLRWQGNTRASLISKRGHNPEVCLPAAGLRKVTGPEPGSFVIDNLSLPFQRYSYTAQGRLLYVFWCTWEDGDERWRSMRAKGMTDRLVGPIEGRRFSGQQTLEIIVSGYANANEAEHAVRQRLPNLIRIEKPTNSTMPTSGQ